jgi:cell division transport system permease protein
MTHLKRIIKAGFVGFWRNSFVTFSSVFVFAIALFAFGSLIFFSIVTQRFTAIIKDRVDINVYFTLEAPEKNILDLKQILEKMPEVSRVEYVSSVQALADFTQKHKDDTKVLEGLKEIGYNPLPGSLNVKAKDPSQYESIARLIEKKENLPTDVAGIIDYANYGENKTAIDRLALLVPFVEKTGSVASLALIVVAVLIVYNSVRLAIFSFRDEIAVMKLVGASNMYARGPFVVGGVMYGLVAGLLAVAMLALATYYFDMVVARFLSSYPGSESVISEFALFNYYLGNLAQIMGAIIGAGVLLGGVSSYLSVRRYLNV